MIFGVLYLIISIAATGSIYYFLHLYQAWYWFWVILIGIPLFYLLLFVLTLGILYICSLFIDMKKEVNKPNRFALFLTRQICHQIHLLLGVRVRTYNMDKVTKKGPYMIIYNHTSNFDPMIIMDKFKNVICITKPENKKIPIAGPFIHKAGFISINRDDDAEGIKSILKAIDYIDKGYGQICVSPEGTRSKTHELLSFHPGCFNIAKRANVPIVCIGFKNVYSIHKNVLKRITKVDMNVLGVIYPQDFLELSTVDISNKIHKLYEDYLEEQK